MVLDPRCWNWGMILGPALAIPSFLFLAYLAGTKAAVWTAAIVWIISILPTFSLAHHWGWGMPRIWLFAFGGPPSWGYAMIYNGLHNPYNPRENPLCYYQRRRRRRRR